MRSNRVAVENRGFVDDMLFMYRRYPGILILHISGAAIAWFAPGDVLSRWESLVEAVAAVGGIFPLLNVAVEKSQFPEVTAVYFALMLAAIPYRLWVGCRMWYAGADRGREVYKNISLKERMKIIFMTPLLLCAGMYFLFSDFYFEWNFIPVSKSRVWLWLVGPLFAGGAQISCISLSTGWICCFLSSIVSYTRG